VTGTGKDEPDTQVRIVMPTEAPQITPAFALALLRVLRIIHRRRAGERAAQVGDTEDVRQTGEEKAA
jgi:hypothetical protein